MKLNTEQQNELTELEKKFGNFKLGVIAFKNDGEEKYHPTMHPANVITEKTATIKSLENKLSELQKLNNEKINSLEAQLNNAEGKTQDAINLALRESQDGFKLKEAELNDKYQKDLINFKKQTAVDKLLFENGLKNDEHRKDISKKFDLEKIELNEDGKIKNSEFFLAPIKESYKPLFTEVVLNGSGAPNTAPPQTTESFYTQEQMNVMTEKELVDNYEKVEKSLQHLE